MEDEGFEWNSSRQHWNLQRMGQVRSAETKVEALEIVNIYKYGDRLQYCTNEKEGKWKGGAQGEGGYEGNLQRKVFVKNENLGTIHDP